MTIGKELAEFRAGFPGCRAVVFADLSTGMVLASDTEKKTTQEKLDSLCDAARHFLTGPDAEALRASFPALVPATPLEAWRTAASGTTCFVKLPDPAAEALCFEVEADVCLAALCRDAAVVLRKIVAED